MSASSPAQAQSGKRVPSVTGCWEWSRPLGTTGGALAVPRDAPFTSIVLRDNGRVVLPRLNGRERAIWEARSYWEVRGDSVEVRVFTGLQAWRAQLSARGLPAAMKGSATYLTDAIASNAALAAGVRLPKGVRSMRPLGFNERSDARADRPAIVVAQFSGWAGGESAGAMAN